MAVTPGSATIGTGQNLSFVATVTGVPVNAVIAGVCNSTTNSPVPCNAVTWTVTSATGNGTIGAASGVYTAPGAAHTDTITATSVYDTTKTVTATVTVVAAVDPTITSMSPNIGAVGAPFQDVYLTGTNFISNTSVFINGAAISPSSIAVNAAATTLIVRVPDSLLSAAGTGTI